MNKIICEDISVVLNEDLPWEKLDGKTVLVTGASGFIGSYIVNTLLVKGNTKVVALGRTREKLLKKFEVWQNNPNLKIIVQDVSEPIVCDEKVDYIIHAASQASPKFYGKDPVGTLKANTIGTCNLLELAKKNNVEKFLYFSTGSVYGNSNDNTPPYTEDYTGNVDITDVRSCYAESKRMGETMCVCYSHQYGFPVNMIRISHTYGPGIPLDDGRVFADFVGNIVRGENIVLNSDGSAKRSFVYISDMLRAMFRVLLTGENRNAYNIASEKETSILELANTLTSLYPEKGLKLEFKEGIYVDGYIRAQSTRGNWATTKMQSLGWQQKIDVKTGFKRMIESYM